jgi:opacity protein-like surface antigen
MKNTHLWIMLVIITLTSFTHADKAITIMADAKSKMETITVDLQKGHFYVGAGVSYMGVEDTLGGDTFSSYAKNIIGGYQYGDYMAVEVRYASSVGAVEFVSSNKANNNNDYPTDYTSAGVYLKALYPLGDMSIYGLLGYGEVSLSNIPEGDTTKSDMGMQWGLGFSYRVDNNIHIFADYVNLYDEVGFDTIAQKNDVSSSIFTLGVSYWF